MPDVTVITPSMPSRERFLVQAMESVAAQTVPAAHLVLVDESRSVAKKRNTLVEAADTEWVAFLDDDDLLDPHHIETLLGRDADVVVPYCRFAGGPRPAANSGRFNRPYDRADLRAHGIFPVTVLARRQAVLDVGGFPEHDKEDWRLWNLMADAGATFEVVPIVTWTYRLSTPGRRTYAVLGQQPPTLMQRGKIRVARVLSR